MTLAHLGTLYLPHASPLNLVQFKEKKKKLNWGCYSADLFPDFFTTASVTSQAAYNKINTFAKQGHHLIQRTLVPHDIPNTSCFMLNLSIVAGCCLVTLATSYTIPKESFTE